MNKNFDIFISYRTSENRQKAEHLYTLLDGRFHGQVSYDKESFAGGRWDEQILSRIDHCKDVIVLLTPETFAKAKEDDASKYEKWAQMPVDEVLREIEANFEADILRTEISRAIVKGKNIVPIVHTPSGTNFAKWSLPRDIIALKRFEGVLYNDDDPNFLMKTLVPKIERLLTTRKRRWWMFNCNSLRFSRRWILILLVLLVLTGILSGVRSIFLNRCSNRVEVSFNKELDLSLYGYFGKKEKAEAKLSLRSGKGQCSYLLNGNTIKRNLILVRYDQDTDSLIVNSYEEETNIFLGQFKGILKKQGDITKFNGLFFNTKGSFTEFELSSRISDDSF